MREMIRDKLIEAAKKQKVVYYAEVGELLNFSMDNPHHRKELGRILGEISTDEHQEGRPLLSAIVVHKENHLPGEGFFKLAKELGKQKPDEDNDTFYTNELRRVFNTWMAANDSSK
jgi:hypothetical protein